MPAWPASLPQDPLLDGFTAEAPDNLEESEMDAGPPRTRRRFTAVEEAMTVSFLFSRAQLNTFRAWLKNDIAGGALPYDWEHPIDNVPCRVRIPKGSLPTYEKLGTNVWRVSFAIRVLP